MDQEFISGSDQNVDQDLSLDQTKMWMMDQDLYLDQLDQDGSAEYCLDSATWDSYFYHDRWITIDQGRSAESGGSGSGLEEIKTIVYP